jgi:hypothetical protein
MMKTNGLIEFTAPAPVRRAVYERDNYTCRDWGLVRLPGEKTAFDSQYKNPPYGVDRQRLLKVRRTTVNIALALLR